MDREPCASLLPAQTTAPAFIVVAWKQACTRRFSLHVTLIECSGVPGWGVCLECTACPAFSTEVGICAANCAISIVSTCLYYSELHRLHDFPFFAAQLNAAIGVLLSGCLLTVLPKDSRASQRGIRSWLWLAALLSIQNSMEIVSIPRVGNDDLPPILQQAVVPLSLVMSTIMLDASYTSAQLLGSAAVVTGVLVGFLPSLFTSDRLQQIRMVWVAVFLLSRLPQAVANVVAEGVLEGHRDFSWAVRATLYTQLLGIPCNFVTALISSAAWKGEVETVLQDYRGGLACVFEGTGSCRGAWHSVLLFSLPGMLYTLT
ncbi:crtp2, partial [Symbiodinium pilosum]